MTFAARPSLPAEPAARPDRLFFCVQKHAARRLHYDFRLELDGVLKSWAVPKGPSFDPAEKRLAVHVEDHPMEYGTFEGQIPAGEYGGGNVVLWDRGEWIPKEDPHEGYKKGKLKFDLVGEKLRGGWTLARMGGRSGEGGKNWLLLKERDAAARPLAEGDVLEERPESVAGAPSIAEAPKAALPATLSPQLATLADQPPTGPEWAHELWYDGYRAPVRIEKGKARILRGAARIDAGDGRRRTRRGRAPVDAAWLDGEVVVMQPTGDRASRRYRTRCPATMARRSRTSSLDAPFLDGRDLRKPPLVARKQALHALIARRRAGRRPGYADHIDGDGAAFFAQAIQHGVEGIVSKRARRAVREPPDDDVAEGARAAAARVRGSGLTDPAGGRVGLGALLLGVRDGDELSLRDASVRGSATAC